MKVLAEPIISRPPQIFLTAEWRALLMVNYEVDPALVVPFVPRGCEIDLHDGKTYLSLVGFLFQNTRLLGWAIPGHRQFEEVNLRFYVKRETRDELRRGVTFLRELVPRRAVALVARWCYNEPYETVPMRHALTGFSTDWRNAPGASPTVEYTWRYRGADYRLRGQATGEATPLVDGTHEHFIAEHYWGYGRRHDGVTLEYEVQHPPWLVWPVDQGIATGNFAAIYGDTWGRVLSQEPASAFIAQGSPVSVMRPTTLLER